MAKSISELLIARETSFKSLNKEELDVTSKDSVIQIVNLKPNVIVNCAAYTSVDGAELESELAMAVNRDGAKNVALAARELDVPLIHISTDYVFAGNGSSPWKTTDKTEPISQYGKSKLEGEREVQRAYPKGSRILRTAWLYGPYGNNFAKSILKKSLSSKEDLFVVVDQKGQPTSSQDLALQIIKSTELELTSGIYHATNSGEASWFEFAQELLHLAGISRERIKPTDTVSYPSTARRPQYSVLDHSDWDTTFISPLDDWRESLIKIFPSIRREVERELGNG